MKSSEKCNNISLSNFNQEIRKSLYFSPEKLAIYPYHISLHSQKPQGANLKYYRFDYNYNHSFHSSWSCISPSITDTKVLGDNFWIDYSPVHKHELVYYPNNDPFPDEVDHNFYTHEIVPSIQKTTSEEASLEAELFNPSKTRKLSNESLNKKNDKKSLSYTSLLKESRKPKGSISIDYPCRICKEIYHRIQEFKAHIKIHTIEPPFNCNVCDKRFKRKSSLIKHWITITCTKKFKEWATHTKVIRLDKLKKSILS